MACANLFKKSGVPQKNITMIDRTGVIYKERENLNAEEAYDKAGIYAEFGKVVCISMGFILQKDGETQIRLKSIANKDESIFLDSLKENIEKRKSSADELLEKYHGSWNRDLTKIFEEYSY